MFGIPVANHMDPTKRFRCEMNADSSPITVVTLPPHRLRVTFVGSLADLDVTI
jgi:hypothetical protein